MKNLLIIFAIFLSLTVKAQEKTKEPLKLGIKTYWSPKIQSFGSQYSIDLGNFSPALTLEKENGNFYEFSLSPVFFAKTSITSEDNNFLPKGSYDQRFFGSGISAEYNYKLFREKNTGRFSFYLGPKIDIGYTRLSYQNQDFSTDKFSYNNLSASVSITPRVMYKISDRVSIDLNCPINILHSNFRLNEAFGSSTNNPALFTRPTVAPRLGIQVKF